MQIPPCPKNNGIHEWRYEKRQHGCGGRRFVYCLHCSQRAQESANGIKFTTGRQFVGEKKSIFFSGRIKPSRKAEILKAGYRSIDDYVNESPIAPKKL